MTDSTATVRPAARADLTAVAAIYRHYVLHSVATFDEVPRSLEDWELRHGELTARGLPFLVAEEAGQVLGFAYAGPWRPKPAYRHTVEDTVYLAPGATGRGLGGALLGGLIEGCERAGARRMIAVVALPAEDDSGSGPSEERPGASAPGASGAASLALHRRFGFADAGRLTAVGYKHGRWLDTLLLERALAGNGTCAR
ncbi:GNAT family N-acetyltransferase [Streptomyces naganishii]|uniref:N-acetyltransferase n=1 Tax=Streptomyces naganishii JCM 4654 TaxID=1306179 RepID=A0A919CXW7_9ACTN|nr:GNAT family N-acetyltransferase [Streptomyces naganishii]GHD93604.1 N-acetyltransferase [Streptomyces naganishii JCM 4654]